MLKKIKMILHKKNLRKLYDCFKGLPPFNDLRMPPARKVTFEVVEDPDNYGMFIPYPMRIQISTECGTFYQICDTLLHEMIHLHLFYNGHTDYNQHEKKFAIYSKDICDNLKLSSKHFG